MTPEQKKITSILLLFFITICTVSYFSFQAGKRSEVSDSIKDLFKLKDSLLKYDDSLFHANLLLQTQRDIELQKNDTLQKRYVLIKDLLQKNAEALTVVREEYKKVPRINNFNSDSLRDYFKNNFDSTKIH